MASYEDDRDQKVLRAARFFMQSFPLVKGFDMFVTVGRDICVNYGLRRDDIEEVWNKAESIRKENELVEMRLRD